MGFVARVADDQLSMTTARRQRSDRRSSRCGSVPTKLPAGPSLSALINLHDSDPPQRAGCCGSTAGDPGGLMSCPMRPLRLPAHPSTPRNREMLLDFLVRSAEGSNQKSPRRDALFVCCCGSGLA